MQYNVIQRLRLKGLSIGYSRGTKWQKIMVHSDHTLLKCFFLKILESFQFHKALCWHIFHYFIV
ncbi:hypothetical protein CLU79DRAFT_769671, partial [Phycomyces nitens]